MLEWSIFIACSMVQEVSKTLHMNMWKTRMQAIEFTPGQRAAERRPSIRPSRILDGKRITIALDDAPHKEQPGTKLKPLKFTEFCDMVREIVAGDFPGAVIHVKSVSDIIRDLPETKSDIVVITCPLDLRGIFSDLNGALGRFRAKNRTSTVVISSIRYHPETEESRMLEHLVKEGLVDRHELLAMPWEVVRKEAKSGPDESDLPRGIMGAVRAAANDMHAA